MNPNIPDSDFPRVVVVGGGFAGLNLVRHLGKKRFQVVMLDRNNYHKFQPLMYQVAMGGLEADSVVFPLRKIFYKYPNFCFRLAEVHAVRPETQVVESSIGNVHYDYLVLAHGAQTNFFGLQSVEERAYQIKDIPNALELRDDLLQKLEEAVVADSTSERDELTNVVVVGGGPTGVEIAGSLAEMKRYILPRDYPELDHRRMKVYLVEGLPQLLSGMSGHAAHYARKYLEAIDVDVITEAMVKNFDGEYVTYNDGQQLRADTLIWSAGVKGASIKGMPEEVVQKNGRLQTDAFNRVAGMENIFAIGDIAQVMTEQIPQGHPMLAPVAIQQGKQLAQNLKRIQQGSALKPFHFHDRGTMATIGRNRAVADIKGFHLHGLLAWVLWSFVHIFSLVSVRNKLVVFFEWFWSYWNYDRAHQLILNPRPLRKARKKHSYRKESGH